MQLRACDSDNSVIYGLDLQVRTLCSVLGDTDKVQFLVGTQTLKTDHSNLVCLLELNEDTNSIRRTQFPHPSGELWHLAACPQNNQIFASCHNSVDRDNSLKSGASIWQYANDTNTDNGTANLTQLATFNASATETVTCFDWQPVSSAGNKAFVLHAKNELTIVDSAIDGNTLRQVSTLCVDSRSTSRCNTAKWDAHHNSNLLLVALESAVRAIDIRSNTQTYAVDSAHHTSAVRSLDVNPNRQYVIVTGADDGHIRFWDVRKPDSVLHTINAHSHWVCCVRYNSNHDQLMLSSSSDAHVKLHAAQSCSSEQNTQQTDTDSDSDNNTSPLMDGCIRVYEEHEESVYACDWSSADPWAFASVSYDGRVCVNRVPKQTKYTILQL